jgi:hypothetical protein
LELAALAEQLNAEYYQVIDNLCRSTKKQASRLRELETQQSTSQYVGVCESLCADILLFLENRKENLLPYAQKLSERQATGHDCRSCTGVGCNLQHDVQLIDLKQSHSQVKSFLHRLQMSSLPLYSESIYPDAYRVLRNQMAIVENGLAELYFLEEAYLIPKVIEAQKGIHVIG